MNRCNTCKHSTRNGGDGWSACDGCIHDSELQDRYTPVTNADHIRSMTDEELEKTFHNWGLCSFIQNRHNDFCDVRGACTNCVIDWLKQPYTE